MNTVTVARPSSADFFKAYNKAVGGNPSVGGNGSSQPKTLNEKMDKVLNLNTSNKEIMTMLGNAASSGKPEELTVLTQALTMRNNIISTISNLVSKIEEGISNVIRNIR